MKIRDLKLVWPIFHVLIGYLKFTIKVLSFIGIWCHKIHLHLTYEWYSCKKRHYKITSSLDFGSTHIVGPWALRYHKQFKQLAKLVNLTHNLETSMIISFHSKGQWHAWSKFSLHKSLELAWRHPHIWTWLLPFSSSCTILFGPCDGLLQNGLCFFYQDWCQTNILWIFHGMVTSLGHRMALTRPHKRCRQPQNFTKHNKSQSGGWGGKIKFSFVFDILCNDTNTKPMFCKHITHKAMAFPNVLIISKNPIVTWQGSPTCHLRNA